MSSHLAYAQAASGSQPASDESVTQEPQASTGTSSLDLWDLLQTSNSHMCARSASPLSPTVLLPSSALYLRTSLRGSGVGAPLPPWGHPRPVLAVSPWVGPVLLVPSH